MTRKFFSIVACLFLWGTASTSHAQGFTDVTLETGVDYLQQQGGLSTGKVTRIMSGGAAAGDFDGDGWIDLYVTRLNERDILFRNLGGEILDGPVRFQDVTEVAGITDVAFTNGAAWGDIDNDGDIDLYVSTLAEKRFFLYLNNGEGGFSEVAVERGAALESDESHSGFGVTFGDYDRDGWLDIHTNEWGPAGEFATKINHSALLRNLGPDMPGFFQNVTASAGVEISPGGTQQAFSSVFSDIDHDGWPDLLIAADFETSQLFWNNGDGTFTNGTASSGIGLERNGMGSTIGDFDGDGFFDWFVTSIGDNRLYRNNGDRTFSDLGIEKGVDRGDWGWGTALFDYDNDGDLDIIMTNGMANQFPGTEDPFETDPMHLWRNDGGSFVEVSEQEGITDTRMGKGLLTFDYDRDGDLDVFVANTEGHPVLYRNDLVNGNSYLRLKLEGTISNRDGLGAYIELEPGPGQSIQIREVGSVSHFLGYGETVAHFGLGNLTASVEEVRVRWPSGRLQILRDLSINQIHRIVEPWDPFDGVFIEGSEDWYFSDWFGFFSLRFESWIFHDRHDFLYLFRGSHSGAVYCFDPILDAWFFTSADTYPWLYIFDQREWVFYFDEPGETRSFYRANTDSFFQLERQF